ncbi:hypothetical protein [Pedobacter aquatilis]|uniref:hypothetical protein n=1 Tax=Pedobacter aquatilis TaxID=351343 RepID=UPI00292EAD0F|nr:hypothetical protein [Pedobacter aquatilis]
MCNFRTDCLNKANLLNTAELSDLLGSNWMDEMIRHTYQTARYQVLKTRNVKQIEALIGIEGKTALYLIDEQYYLFEDIDIWIHEVYASKQLMCLIVEQMRAQQIT